MITDNKIIGFGGGFCAGKTTACRFLQEDFDFIEMNFADKLKNLCKELFDMENKDRGLLQKMGLALRDIDENVWVNYIFKKIDSDFSFKRIAIGDVRFENELDFCKKNNILTVYLDVPLEERITRHKNLYGYEPTKEQIEHISEKIDRNKFDIIIKPGNIEEFKTEIRQILNEYLKDERLFLKYQLELDMDLVAFRQISGIDVIKNKQKFLEYLKNKFSSVPSIEVISVNKK